MGLEIIAKWAKTAAITILSILLAKKTVEFSQSKRWQRATAAIATVGIFIAFVFSTYKNSAVVYTLPILLASYSLILIDLVSMRIPNSLTLCLTIIQTLFVFLRSYRERSTEQLYSIPIAVFSFSLFLLMNLLSRDKLGMGDVKLSYSLALGAGSISIALVPWIFTTAFILAGLFAFGLLLLRKANRSTSFPFGPFMIIGTWISIFIHSMQF